MASKKTSVVPFILGGGLLVVMLGGKKKSSSSTSSSGSGVPGIPGPEPEVDVDKDGGSKPSGGGGSGGGGGSKPSVGSANQKEKDYINFYYNLGMYKLQKIDPSIIQMPAQYVEQLSVKGNKSDAEWLTNISYWALYAAAGNESGTSAPWKITDPNSQWAKVWQRMYNYAATLKF